MLGLIGAGSSEFVEVPEELHVAADILYPKWQCMTIYALLYKHFFICYCTVCSESPASNI